MTDGSPRDSGGYGSEGDREGRRGDREGRAPGERGGLADRGVPGERGGPGDRGAPDHRLPDLVRGDRTVPYSFEEPLACPIGEDRDKEHFWDDPTHVKWLLRIFYAVCVALFAIDFFFHRHVEHPMEHWWGFYPLYGFISCTLLVLVAKEMRKVLMRDEDYYDAD